MHSFDSDGWKFDYEMVAQGGLVLKNITHDGYYMGKDIRVVRIWLNPGEADAPWLALGTVDFDIISPTTGYYGRSIGFNAPPPFDIYTTKGLNRESGIQAIYKSKLKAFLDNNDPDDDYLTIEQSYIFTPYGKDPPHEPGGVLNATRIFPLIKFSYGGKKIKSIRIDYRLEPSMDLFYYKSIKEIDTRLDTGVLKTISKKDVDGIMPCLAGVFRDNENPSFDFSDLNEIFSAVEKPVLHELYSFGLKNGIPGEKLSEYGGDSGTGAYAHGYFVSDDDKSTWDNIHIWPNKKVNGQYLKKQPSSPGAFHCIHLHWRWARVAGHPQPEESLFGPDPLGEEQFQGISLSNLDIGGPLLDSKIPNQTIRFAITKNEDPKYEKLESKINEVNLWDVDYLPSNAAYETLFFDPSTQLPKPRSISDGENLILWYSIEVHNETGNADKFEGTVFIHGLYFAHNPEVDDDVNIFAGTVDKELQKPTYKTVKWQRSPNGK